MSTGRPVLIGLAGPSASGKSTLARRAEREWTGVEIIKADKFFREAEEFPMVGQWRDWERPENICWDELVEVLEGLKRGEQVEVPAYSKPEGRRTGKRLAGPARIVVVEGFLSFWDRRVVELCDLRVVLTLEVSEQRRRRLERDPGMDRRYFDEVVVPGYRRYGVAAEAVADVVIDAGREPEAVWREFNEMVSSYLDR